MQLVIFLLQMVSMRKQDSAVFRFWISVRAIDIGSFQNDSSCRFTWCITMQCNWVVNLFITTISTTDVYRVTICKQDNSDSSNGHCKRHNIKRCKLKSYIIFTYIQTIKQYVFKRKRRI